MAEIGARCAISANRRYALITTYNAKHAAKSGFFDSICGGAAFACIRRAKLDVERKRAK
jgi:hypothetical protein